MRRIAVLVALAAASLASVPTAMAAGPPSTSWVQAKLTKLRIDPQGVDGVWGPRTANAICAFRTLAGMQQTRGRMSRRDVSALKRADRLPAAKNGRNYLSVSLTCQMLFQVRDGRYVRVIPVSSGTAKHATPTGTYSVHAKTSGWHESTIYSGGMMHSPLYFRTYLYAIHGSTSVPPAPASHGCIRVRVADSRMLYREVPRGTKVIVYGRYT